MSTNLQADFDGMLADLKMDPLEDLEHWWCIAGGVEYRGPEGMKAFLAMYPPA
jgi:hypothetical protein